MKNDEWDREAKMALGYEHLTRNEAKIYDVLGSAKDPGYSTTITMNNNQ